MLGLHKKQTPSVHNAIDTNWIWEKKCDDIFVITLYFNIKFLSVLFKTNSQKQM